MLDERHVKSPVKSHRITTEIYCRLTNIPPSTSNCDPFTYRAASEAQEDHRPGDAVGCADPTERNPVVDSLGGFRSLEVFLVDIGCDHPGATQLQVIPCGPRTIASDCMSEWIPALVGV